MRTDRPSVVNTAMTHNGIESGFFAKMMNQTLMDRFRTLGDLQTRSCA